MGKLIKNHWARLIVLTAATCKSFLFCSLPFRKSDISKRPSCCRLPRFLLAQGLLGFSDKEPRRRREACPDPANHKSPLRYPWSRLGMAAFLPLGNGNAPQYGGATGAVSTEQLGGAVIVPEHECGTLLSSGNGSVLLGFQ